ncbi:myosin-2 heavy chain-like [Dreissena polymorpha]|uniref:Uncharacterized protein n=1 Tax=Dreissena polymorpha TaxID=45954 RepID=A0A9D4DGP6_DREPO|nr:myosin-2 heavy chain-like [Dreissena polymorpha]KAH3748513.1 hypothetical protein DPMN_182959 [Dreissena polymorpha]
MEEATGGSLDDENANSGSDSLNCSQTTNELRHALLRPPNKKRFDEEKEEIMREIQVKDQELKSLAAVSPNAKTARHKEIRLEREAAIAKRRNIDTELATLKQQITEKMGQLSRTESNLHIKNEQKIDDTIKKLEWQLRQQNFRLAEERRIVAEVDKLKRSKKFLEEYNSQKKEVDKMRAAQKKFREEKDVIHQTVFSLNKQEEELRKTSQDQKMKYEECKRELDRLHEKKRQLLSEQQRCENELKQWRSRKRSESFRRREELRLAKEEQWQKEQLEFEKYRQPFEDEINLCNTLISYVQRYVEKDDSAYLASPREENPHPPLGSSSSFGPADSLDDGKFVLLKKSEEPSVDYAVGNRPRRSSKKSRKLSGTKPLPHTPQILKQFSSLKLEAPGNVSKVQSTLDQLTERKKYFEEQAALKSRQMLGNLNSSFSGSMTGTLDSPMRERATTWGMFEMPPAILETRTPSDTGESGIHDMSRQASKTESSESTAEVSHCDQVLEDLIKQSAEYQESEASRSSGDTITMEMEEIPSNQAYSSNQTSDYDPKSAVSQDHSEAVFAQDNHSMDHDLAEINLGKKTISQSFGDLLNKGGHLFSLMNKEISSNIENYDTDFPPTLCSGTEKALSDKRDCDNLKTASAGASFLQISSEMGDNSSLTGISGTCKTPVLSQGVTGCDIKTISASCVVVKDRPHDLNIATGGGKARDNIWQGMTQQGVNWKQNMTETNCDDEAVVRDLDELELENKIDEVTHL